MKTTNKHPGESVMSAARTTNIDTEVDGVRYFIELRMDYDMESEFVIRTHRREVANGYFDLDGVPQCDRSGPMGSWCDDELIDTPLGHRLFGLLTAAYRVLEDTKFDGC